MKIIEPNTIAYEDITSSILFSEGVWSSTTPYIPGSIITYYHHDTGKLNGIYVAVTGSTNEEPTDYANNPGVVNTSYWTYFGIDPVAAPFDGIIGTEYDEFGDIGFSILLQASASGIAFFSMQCDTLTITIDDPVEGEVYNSTISGVNNSMIDDYWEYFNAPIEYKKEIIVSDIPAFSGNTLNFTVATDDANKATKIGEVAIGPVHSIGDTIPGTGGDLEDYSIKEQDAYGNYSITERAYANIANFNFKFETTKTAWISSVRARLRATPAVYYSYEGNNLVGPVVYGFVTNYSPSLGANVSEATMEVTGLV